MRKLIPLLIIGPLFALISCTPQQARSWQVWHARDPGAAEAYARRGCPGTSGCDTGGSSSPSPSSGSCGGIYDEMRRQGASSGVASNFAYHIAPRESGCTPQLVHDGDDWSYSRFGLNGLTAGLRSTWQRWCGADVRWDTRILSTDVRCALAAYSHMGWQPWS